MAGRVSPVSIVRIVVVFLHVRFSDTRGEEKEEYHEEHSLPEGIAVHIKHLVVKQVHFRKPLQIILLAWGISDGPLSEVVHVNQLSPRVLELRTVLQDLVFELGLLCILTRSERLLESLR